MQINIIKPVVSIIIAVYNRERTFFRALESVLSQSFQNFEVIIVDDGSYDNLQNILFKYSKYDYRIKYIYHTNRETAISLNTGIKIADGKFITFLDSDDEYTKEHLAKRIKYFQRNKNLDLIHSPATIIGNDEDMYVPDARNKKKLIHLRNCIIGATIFGKKEVFHCLKGFRDKYSYDSDFIKRASRSFMVEAFNIKTYIYYRNTKDSILTKLKKSIDFENR